MARIAMEKQVEYQTVKMSIFATPIPLLRAPKHARE